MQKCLDGWMMKSMKPKLHTIVYLRSVGRNTRTNNFCILYAMNVIQVPLHSSRCSASSYIKQDVPADQQTCEPTCSIHLCGNTFNCEDSRN